MQLRDTKLLLVILGVSHSNLQRTLGQDLYRRATSSEGLLSIRKYWDSHCATYSKLPAVALVNSSSCPKGLAPALFLNLLVRLTDLQQWQIWDLWSTLDVRACGLVGCAEFSLLVVLLCAGAAQQHLQAVHGFAGSITKTFAGAHVGSSHAGLCQCCQLMGLPISGVYAALQQQQLLMSSCHQRWQSSSSNSSCCCSSSTAAGQHASRIHSSSKSCCTNTHACQGGPIWSCSSDALQPEAVQSDAASKAAGIGCCCGLDADGCSASTQPQWACGAAAHRQYCAATGAGTVHHHACSRLAAATDMNQQDVELVLCQVADAHARWQQGVSMQNAGTSEGKAAVAGFAEQPGGG